MNQSIQIIPSLLVDSEDQFLKNYQGLEDSVAMIQIDIADGVFVESKTWADPAVIKKTVTIDCELHLMVESPMQELKKWQAVEQVKRILVHYESLKDLRAVMPTLHAYGWEIGLVLNPETSIDVLEPYIGDIRRVMFMGVQPGKQGQAFIPETLNRIRALKQKHPAMIIAVDGAVNEQTLSDLIAAGADAICPGSAIFGNEHTPSENVQRMQEMIQSLTV